MLKEYSRCKLGKRCVVKTDNSYIFRKFTLLVAIKNSKCVGWKLYEKGVMNKERLVEFFEEFVFNKYKNHLIVLDNAGSHRNNYVKDAINKKERPTYLSRYKQVISGTYSVGKLQCHSTSVEAT
jgi:hypothetical protein